MFEAPKRHFRTSRENFSHWISKLLSLNHVRWLRADAFTFSEIQESQCAEIRKHSGYHYLDGGPDVAAIEYQVFGYSRK